jgi:hypothetical protein
MNRTARIGMTAGLVAMSATTLVACSSSSTSSTVASPVASASLVGGMTECTEEIVGTAATEAATALGADNVFTLSDVQCAEGWAVATGILGTGSTAASEPEGAPTSFVFQAEGQFWVPQDKAKVCGSDPAATTAPADATIPAALYLAGCAAG